MNTTTKQKKCDLQKRAFCSLRTVTLISFPGSFSHSMGREECSPDNDVECDVIAVLH